MNCPACEQPNVDGARFCAACGALMPLGNADASDPMIGKVIGGRFRVIKLLGEGGMGRVYVGEQQMGSAVRKVAIKTLLAEFSKDPQVLQRFNRECETVVTLEHANTIKFYDFGRTDSGDLYIAMELVDGESLAAAIQKAGRMPPERVEHIMKQICGSLHEAHDKGIVHRDLKPENVILTDRAGEADFVKVLDFGIAKRSDATDQAREQKLTQAGMVLGTPPYMSPEQFTGKELDRRSDIYSLGVMAYEMLSGQLPFKANTPWEWATQHMTAQPFPFEQTTGQMAAHIPGSMRAAILRALSKKREDRQPTARDFYRELSGAPGATLTPTLGGQAVGVAPTEAFGAMPGPVAGAPMAAPGATEIGDPRFVPGGQPYPSGNMPAPAAMGAAGAVYPPSAYGGAAAAPGPAAGYPNPYAAPGQHPFATPGAQAIAPPPAMPQRSGGAPVALILVAGLVVAGGVVGGIWFLKGRSGDDDGAAKRDAAASATSSAESATSDGRPASSASTAPAAATDSPIETAAIDTPPAATATASHAPPASATPSSEPPPPNKPEPERSPSCNDAIAFARGGHCPAAHAALARCSGPERSLAAAAVNQCRAGHHRRW